MILGYNNTGINKKEAITLLKVVHVFAKNDEISLEILEDLCREYNISLNELRTKKDTTYLSSSEAKNDLELTTREKALFLLGIMLDIFDDDEFDQYSFNTIFRLLLTACQQNTLSLSEIITAANKSLFDIMQERNDQTALRLLKNLDQPSNLSSGSASHNNKRVHDDQKAAHEQTRTAMDTSEDSPPNSTFLSMSDTQPLTTTSMAINLNERLELMSSFSPVTDSKATTLALFPRKNQNPVNSNLTCYSAGFNFRFPLSTTPSHTSILATQDEKTPQADITTKYKLAKLPLAEVLELTNKNSRILRKDASSLDNCAYLASASLNFFRTAILQNGVAIPQTNNDAYQTMGFSRPSVRILGKKVKVVQIVNVKLHKDKTTLDPKHDTKNATFTLVPIEYFRLNKRLKQEAVANGGVLIGRLDLYHVGKFIETNSHNIAVMATKDWVVYVDPQAVRHGVEENGTPAFTDIEAMILFKRVANIINILLAFMCFLRSIIYNQKLKLKIIVALHQA